MSVETLTIRFAVTDADLPTSAEVGKLCRQADIAYRILFGADESGSIPAAFDASSFAEAVADGGGLSVTPRSELPVQLRLRRVTTDSGLAVTFAGESSALRGVGRLCGWTPATQSGDEDVIELGSLEEALASLAGGIGSLKSGLGPAESTS